VVVTAGGRSWATYTVSIQRGGDDTVVDVESGRRTVGSVFDGFHSSSLPTDIGPTHSPCRATASLTVRHRYRSDASKLLDLSGTYAFTSPLTLLAVPLVGSLYVVSAVTAGRVLGYVAAWLVATVPFVARHKGVLGGTVVMLFFGGYFLFQVPQLPVSVGPATLGVILIGWLADLLAVGTPIGWSSIHAFGGGGGWRGARRWGWLAERIATSLWFGESVDVSDTGKASVSPRMKEDKRPLAQAIRPLGVPFITGPTRHVVEWSLLRARREPQRLNFLFIPVFGVGSAVVNMILQGSGSLAIPAQPAPCYRMDCWRGVRSQPVR